MVLFSPFHAIQVDDGCAKLLVVDLTDTVLRRKLTEALEVALDRDAENASLHNELVDTPLVNEVELRSRSLVRRSHRSFHGGVIALHHHEVVLYRSCRVQIPRELL